MPISESSQRWDLMRGLGDNIQVISFTRNFLTFEDSENQSVPVRMTIWNYKEFIL